MPFGEELSQHVRQLIPAGVAAVLDCVGRGVLSIDSQAGHANMRACSIDLPDSGLPDGVCTTRPGGLSEAREVG